MNSPRNTASVFQPAPSSLLQAALLFSISALLPAAENTGPGKPPVAKKIPEKTTLHNDSRIDEYSWLRDIEDPATRKYLQEENQYAEAALQPLQPLAEALQQEIQGRIVQPTTIPSWQEGRYTYYTRSKPNSPYPVYCRKKGRLFAREEVLLDAGSLAREGKSHRVASFLVSPDHTRAAFTIDEEGQGEFSIRILDLETGKPAGGPVAGTVDNFAWSAGGDFLFYARRAGTGGPRTIWLHRLGEKQENDTLLYHERDRDFTVRINKTLDGQFIWLDISNKNSSEVRYLRAADPRGRFQLLAARRTGVKYDLLHQGRSFYIRTNDGSPNSRLMQVPESDTARKNWREKIPAREGIVLENVQLFRHHLALFERHDGRRKVRIQNLDGAGSHYIDFPDHLYSVESWQNREFITNRLRMAYSSMLVPLSFFEYNMDARRWESIHEVRFKGYKREDYSSERIEAKSADGVTVPISLVYRKREKRTPGPLLLRVYGSYGLNLEPWMNPVDLSLLERGVTIGIAHVRGGGTYGERWHAAGKLLKKKNSISDLLACVDHLVKSGYTAPQKLVLSGQGPGALLVGAALNERPALARSATLDLPYVDLLNGLLDKSVPLSSGEYSEWGNPESGEHYAYIKSYSPYDNIRKASYPDLLVTADLSDNRSPFWMAAKWVARIRATAKAGTFIALQTRMGNTERTAESSPRDSFLKQRALQLAFIIDRLGIASKEKAGKN
ncbi:MAG: prolyl oligopeptidase family serine peptidase [Planctomycetota bacterium]|nr:prolyl oligopeptidase family serine peptidase [Planctomycetota bacterium]